MSNLIQVQSELLLKTSPSREILIVNIRYVHLTLLPDDLETIKEIV